MNNRKEILLIENISKSFPGVKALDNVSFTLLEGEIHCIVGENGAGKSTLINLLSGGLTPEEGSIILYGIPYARLTPQQSMALGIQTVYQESILVDTLSVSENIFLGNEKTGYANFFSEKKTHAEAQELINSLGMSIHAEKIVSDLSIAERQIVGIIKAFSRKAKILILDEPTASLSFEETNNLISLLKRMSADGISIIYISHHLEEIYRLADRITILKDGKSINTHDKAQINHEVVVREMVGRAAELFYKREEIHLDSSKQQSLKIDNFSTSVIDAISFATQSGEIFGIGGMVGSGRTELLRAIFGLDKRISGKIYSNGIGILVRSPSEAIKNGICLITEDRKKTGLILTRSVRENAYIAKIEQSKSPILSLKQENIDVSSMVKALRIVTPSIEQDVINLSGGNQQKVVLAKWLLTNTNIFMFDEPTKGIDIGAKEEIYRLIVALANQNKIIILVSSDMPELIAMSDRIGVMNNGKLVKILNKDEISEETILKYSIGMEK